MKQSLIETKEATTEQQEQIERDKTLESVRDPNLKKTFSKLWTAIETSPLQQNVEEFKKEISAASPKPEQQIFAFLPHQMAKTSIFFPMSDRALKEGNRKINRLEHKTGWGKIVIEGIKLAIFEEDIFLIIIKIAKERIKTINGDYVLTTSMNEIINKLYGRAGYTKKSIERIERALQNFQLVRFELTTFNWKKKGNERVKTERVRSIGNIVQSYDYDKETKKLIINFNKLFFAYFLESMLTNINLSLRKELKKDGSKALLRFLSTHTEPSQMHILTVLNAINFNTDQPMFKLRQLMKSYIKELKKHGVLGNKTKFRNDMIFFDVLKQIKALPD